MITNLLQQKYKVWLALSIVLLCVLLVYWPNISRGYSDSDDFGEIYRTLKLDIPHPQGIFTTPHGDDTYRPVNRGLTYLNVLFFGPAATSFLIRNLVLHLVSCFLVFDITRKLTKRLLLSMVGALLFGLFPPAVNNVSVAVPTYSFSSFCLLGILDLLVSKNRKNLWIVLTTVWLLSVVVVFSSEAFLWLPPLLLVWGFVQARESQKRDRSEFRLDVIWSISILVILLGFLAIRQSVVPVKDINALSATDRTGIKTPVEIAKNFLILFAGSGSFVDFLFFMNPLDDGILRNGLASLLNNPGVTISMAISTLVLLFIFVNGLLLAVQRKVQDTGKYLPLVFLGIGLCSFSVVSVASVASETYLYFANACFSIATVLLVDSYSKYASSLNARPFPLLAKAILVLALASLPLRMTATLHRNALLQEKAHRIAILTQNLVDVTRGFTGKYFGISAVCPLSDGYSVYGGRSLNMVSVIGWVHLTLGMDTFGNKVDFASLDPLEHPNVILVDAAGNMAWLGQPFTPNCTP